MAVQFTDSSHLFHNSYWNHRTIPVVADSDSPCLDRRVVGTPYLDLHRSKGRDTGAHSRTRESTPGWGPVHIVHSYIGYRDHTVGSTPGDRGQMCNSADAHTCLTRNFVPAHNVLPEDNTAAAGDAAAAVVADDVDGAVVAADYVAAGDDDHRVLHDCNLNDIQTLLD